MFSDLSKMKLSETAFIKLFEKQFGRAVKHVNNRGRWIQAPSPGYNKKNLCLGINLDSGYVSDFHEGKNWKDIIEYYSFLHSCSRDEAINILLNQIIELDILHDSILPTDTIFPPKPETKNIEFPYFTTDAINSDLAKSYLFKRGLSLSDIIIYELKYCTIGPQFGKRVIFPLYASNKLIWYQGRAIDDTKPKYLNLDSEKGKYLYGYEQSKTNPKLIITEGCFDVIKSRGVSLMGLNISPEQIEILKRDTRTKVLALDNDLPGQLAINNLVKIFQKNKIEDFEIMFLPQGVKDLGELDSSRIKELNTYKWGIFAKIMLIQNIKTLLASS